MQKRTAGLIIGGVTTGTVAAAVASFASWSLVPIGIWAASATSFGSAAINIMRLRKGQFWPTTTQVIHQTIDGAKIVALKREA